MVLDDDLSSGHRSTGGIDDRTVHNRNGKLV
jgi:hypothetical protein